jgi:hypothetical protein
VLSSNAFVPPFFDQQKDEDDDHQNRKTESSHVLFVFLLGKQQKKEEEQNAKNEMINLTVEGTIPLPPANILFVFDEEEIARQLTLVDFSVYSSIQV